MGRRGKERKGKVEEERRRKKKRKEIIGGEVTRRGRKKNFRDINGAIFFLS